MTLRLALRFGRALLSHASNEKYPTRSVEYMLAWVMITWSLRVVWPGEIMTGPAFKFMTALMREQVWGAIGLAIGLIRLYALARNGHWRRSPLWRFIGAASGLNWWLALLVLYSAAVFDGAPDFPLRWALGVFAYYEAYSCFRCGQDYTAMKALLQVEVDARVSRSESAGHG